MLWARDRTASQASFTPFTCGALNLPTQSVATLCQCVIFPLPYAIGFAFLADFASDRPVLLLFLILMTIHHAFDL